MTKKKKVEMKCNMYYSMSNAEDVNDKSNRERILARLPWELTLIDTLGVTDFHHENVHVLHSTHHHR